MYQKRQSLLQREDGGTNGGSFLHITEKKSLHEHKKHVL